jgi:hypothetical protein
MAEASAAYVPDGDPCPKAGHEGQPTRLAQLPCGLVSQCAVCIEEFLDWYARQPAAEDVIVLAVPTPDPEPPQLTLGGL